MRARKELLTAHKSRGLALPFPRGCEGDGCWKRPARSKGSLQGLTLFSCQSRRKARGALVAEATEGLQVTFPREWSIPPYLAMIASHLMPSPKVLTSATKPPPPLLAAGLLRARSTPAPLQLPPRPAASPPRSLVGANPRAKTQDAVSKPQNIPPLAQAFPEETVSQQSFTVRKFNDIQLKFSFINVIPLLLAACSISLLSLQCLCT